MREIKFRAWHTELGMSDLFGIETDLEALPEAIMQFTGVKDKNGKEIFEGDIVKHNGNVLVVKFFDKYGRFACSTNYEPNKLNMRILDFESCEIIGNIYENPELLEQ